VILLASATACSRRIPEPAATKPAATATATKPAPTAPASVALLAAPPAREARPAAALQAGGTRFAVIGDYGADVPPEGEVASMVKSWNPAFILTLGDNNYPRGEARTIDANIGKYYAEFIGHYQGAFGPGSVENRFWPSLGNHDWITPGAAPYLAYFTLPGNERYYDVDLGMVHLYALDSDINEPDGIGATSVQARWLQGALAASHACYDLVFFHHPPYSSGPHGSLAAMRWPFRTWGAEAVLTGHDHVYERFSIEGIPYFVNGLGGASRYEFGGTIAEHSELRYNEGYGAMVVTANPGEISYEFFTIDGQRRDQLTWKRPDTPCGTPSNVAH
jgi:tartrate-resistant acid phosphatase type 5